MIRHLWADKPSKDAGLYVLLGFSNEVLFPGHINFIIVWIDQFGDCGKAVAFFF